MAKKRGRDSKRQLTPRKVRDKMSSMPALQFCSLSLLSTDSGPSTNSGPGTNAGPGLNSGRSDAASNVPSQETMRRVGWEVGEKNPASLFVPETSAVALHWVAPKHGFAHWRIKQEWIDATAKSRGAAWTNCRMVLKLYDVSFIIFNGLNAHHISTLSLPQICGHIFFHLPRPGTTQLAEVGFELRNGEFIAAARSFTMPFPPESPSSRNSQAGLLVDDTLQCTPIGNLWEQDRILTELRKPVLRHPLRIAMFTFDVAAVSELAKEQCAAGHGVHVFSPERDDFTAVREADGVVYHPIAIDFTAAPVKQATRFATGVEKKLATLPHFDLFHVHEWIAGKAPWITRRPAILSVTSLELTRRNGGEATPLSLEIEQVEREILQAFKVVLMPEYLRAKAIDACKLPGAPLVSFPIQGRLPNEWETPLDVGKVKQELGFGPIDRVLLFVGPLEHGAGPDLLIEALPSALHRAKDLRIAFIGMGRMHDALYNRAHRLGVHHAMKIFGKVDGEFFKRAVRAAEALVFPARHRYSGDGEALRWARLAGKAVIATHGGVGYLVKHDHTGLVTYDNPGSMNWAIDRVLSDPAHTVRMGEAGRQQVEAGVFQWSDVARRYLELCAEKFAELT